MNHLIKPATPSKKGVESSLMSILRYFQEHAAAPGESIRAESQSPLNQWIGLLQVRIERESVLAS
jgi:hypothetical protein